MKTHEECMRELIAFLDIHCPERKPKPKPKLKAINGTADEEAVLRRTHERAQRELMEEERRRAAAREQERKEAVTAALHARLDRWMEDRRSIEAHERWLKRQLDPFNLGLYEVEPCHRGPGED